MDTTQKYKLDVEMLLRTVMSLEAQFAEQARQTSIPYWATDLVNRISSLEAANESLKKNILDVFIANKSLEDKLQKLNLSQVSAPINIEHSTSILDQRLREDSYSSNNMNQSKLIEKIRGEYEAYVQSVKNNMELKFSSLSMEVERAYKLIQSRPTTTDFQHVTHQIQAVETKLYENIQEVSSMMKSTMQESVSLEMSHLVNQLKNNENLNEQTFHLIFTRFDNESNEFEKMRGNMKEFTEFVRSKLDEITNASAVFTAQMEANKDKTAQQLDELTQRMTVSEENQASTTERYVEIKTVMSRRLLAINDILSQHDAKHTDATLLHESKIHRIHEQLAESEEALRQLRKDTEREQIKLSDHLLSHDERLQELEEHGQSVDDEIDLIQSNHHQAINKIAAINNRLEFHASKIDEFEAKLKKEEAVNSSNHQIIEDIQEQIIKIGAESSSLAKRLKETSSVCDSITADFATLQTHHKKIDDDIVKLSLLWDETSSIREALKACENREGLQHHSIVKLTESLNEAKASITTLHDENTQRESNMQTKFQEMYEIISRRGNRSVVSSPRNSDHAGKTKSSMDLLQQIHKLSHRLDELTTVTELINTRENIGPSDGILHGHHINLEQHHASTHHVPHDTRHVESQKHHIETAESHHDSHLKSASEHPEIPSSHANHATQGSRRGSSVTHNSHVSHHQSNSPKLPAISGARHSPQAIDDSVSEPETFGGRTSVPVHIPTTGVLSQAHQSDKSPRLQRVQSSSQQQSVQGQSASIDSPSNKQPFKSPFGKIGMERDRSMASVQSKSSARDEDITQADPLSFSSKPAPSDVQTLIEICQAYEDQCVQRSFVLNFTNVITDTIAAISRRQAAQIAATVDDEIVRNTIHSDDNAFMTEDSVSVARQERVLKLLDDVRVVVVERHPQPGVIRADSREKFFKKLKIALDMWLSKYDQVFVIGSSRLGRVKIPTCIACDRPLLRKAKNDIP